MLTPVRMVRVELLVLEDDLLALSQRIGEMALLHPLNATELGAWSAPLGWQEMDELAALYASADRRLDRLEGLLRLPRPNWIPEVGLAPWGLLSRVDGLLGRVEPAAKELEGRLRGLESRRQRLNALEAQLELLSTLNVDLSELRALHFLHMVSGLLPREGLLRLEQSLRDIPHLLLELRRVGDRELVLAFTDLQSAGVLNRALESSYLERLEIPSELNGTPAEALARLADVRSDLEREADAAEAQRDLLTQRWGEELTSARAELDPNSRVVAFWRGAVRTERTRLLAGWIPAERSHGFAETVSAVTNGRSILAIGEPEPNEEWSRLPPPTALANPSPLQPFEGLTRTYGLPDYWDLDPTPVAAVLFVLLFGAMFGDVGQGLVLLVAGGLLALGLLVRGQRDFGVILAACGLSAMLFGVLYGSVFAAEGLIPSFWIRPMMNPTTLLTASVLFGMGVLSIGLLLGIWGNWRRRDYAEFYLGQNGLTGLWLYWGLVAALLLVVLGGASLSLWLLIPLVVLPLALRFLHGPIAEFAGWRHEAGGSAYAVQAGVESFDLVIRFISNTASFLRVGAFALGHVGLGLTIFALAALLGNLTVASIVILALGNLLIMTLEVLIVGIQALRLEYYEFFTKFLHGGGVTYRPFALWNGDFGR